MKEIKLHAIGNQDNFNYYIFDKKQEVAERIADIVRKIFNLNWNFYEEYKNRKKNWISRKINIEKYKDVHSNICRIGSKERVDIFYGNKKMFITLYCSLKKRLKFNEELFNISDMPKPKKIKKQK